MSILYSDYYGRVSSDIIFTIFSDAAELRL